VNVGGRQPSQQEIDTYRNGDAGTDHQAQRELEQQAGAQRTGGGKFVFVELSPGQTDRCLGKYFFCNVDCAESFGMQ